MKSKSKVNFYNFLFFFALYLSLIIGFFLGENLNHGSKPDWLYTDIPPIKDFAYSFKTTFLNYDQYNHRHSPVYIIFLSYLFDLALILQKYYQTLILQSLRLQERRLNYQIVYMPVNQKLEF